MKTKFIEGTNKQYSIREDGFVFRNYIDGRPALQLKTMLDKTVCITINKKKFKPSIRKLMFDHYGFKICKSCNSKIFDSLKGRFLCDDCKLNKKRKRHREYKKRHPEVDKNYAIKLLQTDPERYYSYKNKVNYKIRTNITKAYVSTALKIPVADLSDDLYHHHRNFILFKRQVAKELNIPIQRLT